MSHSGSHQLSHSGSHQSFQGQQPGGLQGGLQSGQAGSGPAYSVESMRIDLRDMTAQRDTAQAELRERDARIQRLLGELQGLVSLQFTHHEDYTLDFGKPVFSVKILCSVGLKIRYFINQLQKRGDSQIFFFCFFRT